MNTKFISFLTLFKREFNRFFKVPNNTILPHLITTLFYFLIFGIAIGSRIKEVAGVDYLLFILPGLFVQNLINGSYSNPSGSLYVSRNFGNMSDILIAPISNLSLTLAYVIAGMLRGIVLALGTVLIALFFTTFSIENYPLLLIYIFLISFAFACMGVIIGLWAKTFDQLNIFINFVVTPLTFLGGVFYTTDIVPNFLATITKFNPIFYMINGTRYAMIGVKDGNVYIGLIFLIIITIILFYTTFTLIKKGYNLRT
ncbi:hypothetical protein CL617_05560 [archaeon]|nr:hypothetical protein [archaeon]|tara:strand:- start:6086 stop:6853 length:768 start_codon:yes stop_codon:yes gene_type:complete